MHDLLILCYHAVDPSWPAELSVTTEAFEQQIAELSRAGYRGMGFSDALRHGRSGRVVAVTFDDGYRSVLEQAKPILDRHGYPATLFVPTDWAGSERPMRWPGIDRWLGTEHEGALHPLGWGELEQLAGAGWEIGSHTCSHPRLSQLDDRALASELTVSKQRIESELGRSCTSLAYPYGDFDERVLAAARAAGYECACTIPRVLAPPRPLRWPRVSIYHDDDLARFHAKVSPRVRRLRASLPGRSLDRARVAWAQRGASGGATGA
jgi:peptidoglycan/xylan/chitin deacetylase (PgdA/CDA1 family)